MESRRHGIAGAGTRCASILGDLGAVDVESRSFVQDKAETVDAVLQLVLPEKARKEIIDQLHGSPVNGGHFSIEKTLARIKQRFWWPGMRRYVEKRISWCLPFAARTTAGNFQLLPAGNSLKKRTAQLKPFKVGIRFHTVAADILGPVTKATKTGAKY